MTVQVGPAVALDGPLDASARRAVSARGSLLALRQLFFTLGLPYATLVALQTAITSMPVELGRTVALAGPAVVLAWLWRRGNAYALWAALLLALQVHATTWGALPSLGVPVRVEYAIVADRVLGLGELPTVALQAWTPEALAWPAFFVYASFFAAPILVFLGVWRLDRGLAAVFARSLVCASFVSLVVMAAVPTAPPWMAARDGAAPAMERIGERLVGAAAHGQAEEIIGVNEVAAMPSLHTASTALIAFVLGAAIPRLRRWAWLYPLAMGFALVYMGEHYVVDVLAGIATAWLAWHLALTNRGPFAPSASEGARRM